VTTLGNAQKIIHPEGVAAILSRSRKVWSQISNRTKMVAGRKDRGERPTANAWLGQDRIGQPCRNWGGRVFDRRSAT
jgi:hypothetical protein